MKILGESTGSLSCILLANKKSHCVCQVRQKTAQQKIRQTKETTTKHLKLPLGSLSKGRERSNVTEDIERG